MHMWQDVQSEYFEQDGVRVEVMPELRAQAAAIRRDVAEWTGTLPATVPMEWPSGPALFQLQSNRQLEQSNLPPLYAWGAVADEEGQSLPRVPSAASASLAASGARSTRCARCVERRSRAMRS